MSYHAGIERRIDEYLAELAQFVAIPSVSTDAAAAGAAAAFTAQAFARRGFATEIVATAGNPVVVASGGAGERSILLYNHYDVQPAEPIAAWTTPAFIADRRDGKLFGRGIIDDKGEIIARLAAIDAVRERLGTVPLRIVACVEGEEEAGSPNLGVFVREHRDRLRADACIWEAGSVDGDGRPEIWLGLRGLAYVHLSVKTLAHDAHSGWAHVLPNAAWRLVHALAELVDAEGQILVAGLADGVPGPTPSQRALLDAMPDEDDEFQREFGVARFVGGRHSRDLRAAVFLPTCNIAGFWSGSIGDASKTVIPAEAHAKIDLRLPPGLVPQDAVDKLRDHLERRGFGNVVVAGCEAELAACSDPDHPFVKVAIEALRDAYGVDPVVSPLIGGTGPAAHFVEELSLPFVSIGCSYPGARKHAPDENIRIADFIRGAAAIATVLERFAQAPQGNTPQGKR